VGGLDVGGFYSICVVSNGIEFSDRVTLKHLIVNFSKGVT